MNVLGVEELKVVASREAMEFVESFIKQKGAEMSQEESAVFDGARPTLELTYSHAYRKGYIDAIDHMVKDRDERST